MQGKTEQQTKAKDMFKMVSDQQDTNSKGVEIEAVKNKDILTRVKEVLGK